MLTTEQKRVDPDQATPSVADRVAKIFSLKGSILAGANGPEGTQAAGRFAAELDALAREAPTQDTRDVLDALLSTEELDRFVDGAGVPCRVAVVNALLALGFPYALEVSPDDLQLARKHAPKWVGVKGVGWLRGAAVLSMVWSFGWIGMIAKQAPGPFFGWGLLVSAPFLIAAAHGLTALITSFVGKPRTQQKVYSALAWLGLLGPAAAVLVGTFGPGLLFFGGLLIAGPAMVTAWLARAEERKLRDGL